MLVDEPVQPGSHMMWEWRNLIRAHVYSVNSWLRNHSSVCKATQHTSAVDMSDHASRPLLI